MNIIILHGTGGSPEINWFPWLKKEAVASGHKVFIPRFPTPENQTKENWCIALQKQAPVFDKNTILIGHSTGGTFLLHILETVKEPVNKSVFVAPVLDEIGIDEYDTLNKSFLKTPDFDWLSISNNAGEIFLLHGDDDPYVPATHSEFLQDQIGGELIIVPKGGHLNGEAGFIKFDLLMKIIKGEIPCHMEMD